MRELFAHALGGDATAISGVAALLSIVAIIPAAILFIINQIYQNAQLREEKHRYVTEQYQMFLTLCLEYPEFRLEYGASVPASELSDDQRYRRDALFDLLTSVFERAYLTYSRRISSHHRTQWDGWDDYVDLYVEREDYRDWWLRINFGGDPTFPGQSGRSLKGRTMSQYDVRFERYILKKLRRYQWSEPEEGLVRQRSRLRA